MRAHVWFFHTSLVRSDVVTHPILPLKTLLADRTGVGLLVRVGQPVPIQMVHVPESLPTCLTSVVFPYGVGVGVRAWAGVWSRNRVWVCDWD